MKGASAWPDAITEGMAGTTRRTWAIAPIAVPTKSRHLISLPLLSKATTRLTTNRLEATPPGVSDDSTKDGNTVSLTGGPDKPWKVMMVAMDTYQEGERLGHSGRGFRTQSQSTCRLIQTRCPGSHCSRPVTARWKGTTDEIRKHLRASIVTRTLSESAGEMRTDVCEMKIAYSIKHIAIAAHGICAGTFRKVANSSSVGSG